MSIRNLVVTVGLCALVPMIAAADFKSTSDLRVLPVSTDSFTVLEGAKSGGSAIWCAAGEFAAAMGRDAPRQRLWVVAPRGDAAGSHSRKGVTFSLVPEPGMNGSQISVLASTWQAGANFSVQHALVLCTDFDGSSSL